MNGKDSQEKMERKKIKVRKGFTLVELLAVIVILGILTSLSIVADSVGFTSTVVVKFKQDKTIPACNISNQNTSWTRNDVNIGVSCTDSGSSGCQQTSFTKIYNANNSINSDSVVIKDNAGNSRLVLILLNMIKKFLLVVLMMVLILGLVDFAKLLLIVKMALVVVVSKNLFQILGLVDLIQMEILLYMIMPVI